ncbi:hypothetical protein HMPREF9080_02135 [Cardiobacterium valvarum F0432]|uniref:Uncharacterized protein n=1 Tax=Cardiobacterium valvarum F0432 TaxID=797473 RepID=G9ZH77_9GAMM|nr:hypothetical protein HMPREF9080_02135 [Cardiobacterium valvarum F0432]
MMMPVINIAIGRHYSGGTSVARCFIGVFFRFFLWFFYRDRKGQVSVSLTSVNDFLRHL